MVSPGGGTYPDPLGTHFLPQEICSHPQGTGSSRRLERDRTAIGRPLAKNQVLYESFQTVQASHSQVGFARFLGQHASLRLLDAIQDWRGSALVTVNTHRNVDLVRIGILAKQLGQAQDGIRRGHL